MKFGCNMLKPAPYAMPVEKAMFYAGWVFTAIVLLFLIAPILAVMPLSFNAEPYFSYPMPGLSLQWYRDFFGNERWWGSLVLSVKLAVTVTLLSTILGTMAALGLARTHLPLRPVILGTLLLPIIVPVIIVAVATYMFYGRFGLIGTFMGLVLAHTALATPFVVITVTSTLTSFNWDLQRSAQSLGASPIYSFRRVICRDFARRGDRRIIRFVISLMKYGSAVLPAPSSGHSQANVQWYQRNDQPTIRQRPACKSCFCFLVYGVELLRRRKKGFAGYAELKRMKKMLRSFLQH